MALTKLFWLAVVCSGLQNLEPGRQRKAKYDLGTLKIGWHLHYKFGHVNGGKGLKII